jgi:hypothetical protein
VPELLHESVGLTEARGKASTGRMLITLITPGWGSSGYYSAEALQAAAVDRVWPANTQMHIDHQTAEERATKPEGSVSTLAAVLQQDAFWDPDYVDPKTGGKGRLAAESKVFSRWREPLSEMAEHIGVSIVAPADVTAGEAEGRPGRIITKLYASEVNRVDFVTHAGRGGNAVVVESAKVQEARNVGQWLEARLHSMFTSISDDFYGEGRLTREERISLSSALGDALTAFTATVEAQAPQLFERDLWDDPEPTPADAMEALRAAITHPQLPKDEATAAVIEALSITPTTVPAIPGQTRQEPHQEGTNMAEVMIESTRLETLEESHGRVPALVQEAAEATQRAEAAERRAAVAESTVRARQFADRLVRDANSELPDSVVGRIVESATATIPLTDDLRLDTDTLTESVTAAREAEETYLARLSQEAGIGSVRGVGEQEDTTETAITAESAREQILALTGRK